MKGYIYKHTAPNGKAYVGQTTKTNPNDRWGKDGSGYRTQQYFWRAIKKYGWENITHTILEEIEFDDIDVLNNLEENYILNENTLWPNGYNLKTDGLNYTRTQDYRDKISKANKGSKNGMYGKPAWNRGKKASPEVIEKNRLSHLGIKQSDETKLKKSRTVSNLIWVTDGVNNKRIPSNQIIPEGFYKGRIYTENGIKSMKDKLHKRMLGNTYGKGKKGKDSPSYKEISKEIIDSIMSDFKYIKDGIMYYNITLYLFNRAYKEYYGHKFKDRNKK